MGLAGAGISEADIIKINKILSMTDYHFQDKERPLSKESLIADLQKYGNLKLVINNLENILKKLKSSKRSRDRQIKKELDTVKKTEEKHP